MIAECIYHSGCMVETESAVLIFDYYKGNVREFDKNKKLYVFVSHKHSDHFNKEIFEMFKDYEVHYILSKDCKMNEKYLERCGLPVNLNEKITYVRKNETYNIDILKVETLESTDAGVAYMVSVDGKEIFHGGDLGCWTWPGKDEEYNRKMEEDYKRIIDGISGRYFDVAFVPAEPGLREDFYKGVLYFLEKTNAKEVYAVHMWGKKKPLLKLLENEKMSRYKDRLVEYEN